jgi:hypothetical protein
MKTAKDMPTKKDQIKAKIVERHINAMLKELNEHDLEALGVAGGIIFAEKGPLGTGSACHTFYVVEPGVVPANTLAFNEDEFIADVAKTMLQGVVS